MRFDLQRWSSLPVAEAMPRLSQALAQSGAAVLQAPPGAGKTTLAPLDLLAADWLAGRRILMLEPRRLAARMAARRMAEMIGETVGETVGFRTRTETRVGSGTRIEVLTEGILLRLIEADPALETVGLLIFDEFHERSLDADLGLAFALDAKANLRPDLRLLVMSATLAGEPVARLLGDAPVVTSVGRSFPVELRHIARRPEVAIEPAVAAAVRRALAGDAGGILVFLPGGAEIRRVARLVEDEIGAEIVLTPLYGDLPPAAQDAALRPAPPGKRKLVLATSIAETSLTIDGIAIVIDSGLMRVPRYEPASGMTRLVTEKVSQAAAEQRSGRAGRLGPGISYRLWSAAEQAQLQRFNTPEILETDLAPLALAIAQWGCRDPAELNWLDPPPPPAYDEACALLRRLEAMDEAGRITPHGRDMARLGLPPRLAHMAIKGRDWGESRLAGEIAALLLERDPVRAGARGRDDADLRTRLELVRERGAEHALTAGMAADRNALERARLTARQLARRLGGRQQEGGGIDSAGRLLAQAYPDRIAQLRAGGNGQFLLANGRGASLPPSDPLAREEFLAVGPLDGDRRAARIFLAAPLDRTAIERDFAASIATQVSVVWDTREEAVLARRRTLFCELVLKDKPLADPPVEEVAKAALAGVRALGLASLPWTRQARQFRQRIAFAARCEPGDWPDVSDDALEASLEAWLSSWLAGVTRRAHFQKIDLAAALGALLAPSQRGELDRLAPSHVAVPSGSRVAVDYDSGEVPVLAVRLQEMFGSAATPSAMRGRVPLVLHLLSPAGRPLAVTRDIASFWHGGYAEVRRTMRGRYPRHAWPEDPLAALAPRRARHRA